MMYAIKHDHKFPPNSQPPTGCKSPALLKWWLVSVPQHPVEQAGGQRRVQHQAEGGGQV